jgi:hypothetical protein
MKTKIICTFINLVGLYCLFFVQPAMSRLVAQNFAGINKSNYKTYNNSRFTFSISYPANVLIMQPPPQNGDGRSFISQDGRAKMLVYGRNNAYPVFDDGLIGYSLKELYDLQVKGENSQVKKRVVSYKTLGSNWFVVSGVEDGKIFYTKTFVRNRQEIITFYFEYPQGQKNVYDKMTEVMVRSFKI